MYFKSIISIKTVSIGSILAVIYSFLLPTQDFERAVMAWLIACIIDIITKYYSVSVKYKNEDIEAKGIFKIIKKLNKGFYNAMHLRKLDSSTLWSKTSKKFFEFLIILILLATAHQFDFIQKQIIFFSNVIFFVAFMREFQSILENLIDAGHDLGWLRMLVSKKIKEVTESEEDKTN